MSKQWTYVLVNADDAAKLAESPDCQVWSSSWKAGFDKGAGLFVVATTAAPPAGTNLGSAALPPEKDPLPPPPPPPPGTGIAEYASTVSLVLGSSAPRDID